MSVDHDKLADDVAAAFTGDGDEPSGPKEPTRGETGRVLAAAIKSGDHAAIEDAIEEIARRCK